MDQGSLEFLRRLLENEHQRAVVLEALAPDLPPAAIQPAVDAAIDLGERGRDASPALAMIAVRVIELGDPWLLVGPGEALAPYVPDARLVEFVDLVTAMPDDFRDARSRLLAVSGERLARSGRLTGEDQARWLLDLAMGIAPEARAPVLLALARRHWSLIAAPLLVTSGEASDELTRARLAAAYVEALPYEQRAMEARRLVDTTREMSPAAGAIAAVGGAHWLEPGDRELAVRVGVDAVTTALRDLATGARWTPNAWFWEAVAGAVALAAPEPRAEVTDALHEAAKRLPPDVLRGAYSALAQSLSDEEMMSFTRAVGLEPVRERRPLAGIPVLPPEMIRAVLGALAPVDLPGVIMAALVPVMAEPPPPPSPAPAAPPKPSTEIEVEDDLGFDDDLDDVLAFDELELDDERPMRSLPKPRPAVVNTGFADPAQPRNAISPFQALHPGDWYFWLEIGEPLRGSIERQPVGLLPSVPSGSIVTVALYPVSEGVEIVDGRDTGELEVRPDGSAIVSRGAAALGSDPELALRRLAFPIRVAPGTTEVELRCSIFRRQLLVQSRRIRALVTDQPTPPRPERVLTSDIDYLLVRRLAPRELERIADHRLSLMLNGDGATHNLHALVAGEDGPITHSARFEGGELQDMIVQARRAYRTAAFGSPDPWQDSDEYRYAGPLDRERLEADLLELAVRGYRFYDACINRLAGSYEASVEFAERTLRTASIQIALKQHGGLLLPAALFYDHPLDTGVPDLRLCPEFLAAVGDLDAMLASPCFAGRCPAHDDVHVVCPSGFWGFRHDLGLPLSLDEGDDVSFEIEYDTHPQLGVAVSMDPQFKLRVAHEEKLRGLLPDLGWRYAATRAQVIDLMRMREGPAQLLYFYCHGGLSPANAPFLGVGGVGEPGITSDAFRTYGIRWNDPRPLVFINGCHTTALEPDTALDFVSRLVDTAAAAGVIGTEITTFEPLAGAFALECLGRFLGGAEIGAAVRGARLALLADGNPLGLIYVPFVMPSVKLVDREAALSE
jgi:hypothetical protein